MYISQSQVQFSFPCLVQKKKSALDFWTAENSKQVKDGDKGKTYLQYSTKITAGQHTEGLLENLSTGPGRCATTDSTITKGNIWLQ